METCHYYKAVYSTKPVHRCYLRTELTRTTWKYNYVLQVLFHPVGICGSSTLSVVPPSLFQFLAPERKPVTLKSRRYSMEEKKFISTETNQLLEEGIIEPIWTEQSYLACRNVFSNLANRHNFFPYEQTPTVKEDECPHKFRLEFVYPLLHGR